MKAILTGLIIALIPAIYPAKGLAQFVNCPVGTYLSIDQLGKPNCLRADNHAPAIIQASPIVSCPSGTYPSIDDYGTRVCKSVDQGGPTYYGLPMNNSTPNSSTLNACPSGTFPSGLDNSGNQICRQL